ncbi:MAG: cob(I)yrinic acid a,c-diamide adenosyltransferase [Armatimonadetes bacterium]|nr:cob(I)yrinic acid a,c-diamide adenosyltransferase [Armatimonadota bacterium]
MVHVYTGDGKGKTTAALGLALRALGWGYKVMMVEFVKGYPNIGEIKFSEKFPDGFTVRQFALDPARAIGEEKVRQRRGEANRAMGFAEDVVSSGEFDVVILDELAVALHYGLIDLDRALRMIRSKPSSVELVITGRNAPEDLILAADYVTEMRLIRHPHERSIQARPGIDY